jgi:histidyl-tRNA synthetase
LILEHEIPNGSRLYFGQSANLKRDIEAKASAILLKQGFEEILTPSFSYDQHQSINDKKELISINDVDNNSLTLRADSTLDVVRLITKRVGRSVDHKKWFYIQPIFTYPTTETYQIGAEIIGQKDCTSLINTLVNIVSNFNIKPVLQVSNIKIPKILSQKLDIPIENFKSSNISQLLTVDNEWLKKLLYVHKVSDINEELLSQIPSDIKDELILLKNSVLGIDYDNIVLSPLYYTKLKYYDELYFRVFDENRVIARGGTYKDDDLISSGFAIYTDELVEKLI